MSNATEETLRKLAGISAGSAPAVLVASTTLPAASAFLGGIAVVPVPSGYATALIFVSYADGVGGTGGTAVATVLYGFAATPLFPLYVAQLGGTVTAGLTTPGQFFSAPIPPGVLFLSIALSETGDPTHPGTVAANVSFY
jgi:hypothetical protein